jgi:Sugar-transfer associated ATP-grasp
MDFFIRRCIAGFPWFWPARPPGQQAMVEARRIVRCHYGRDHDPVRRKLAQVFVTIAWPPAVILNLWLARRWLGSREAVLLTIKRIPGALWTAIRHNVLPSEYYAYGLWQPDRRMNVDNYLYMNECTRLFKALNRPSQPNPIDDKLAFHEICKAHAIPTPAVLAAFAPARRLVDFDSDGPPKHDLFVKASTGSSRAERFRWHGIDFASNRGCRLKPEELGGYLADRARTENLTLIVQPVLSNHPDLRVQPNRALATARLVTGRSSDGEVTPIFCVMYFGLADQMTSHSNCVTLIDVAKGRFMPAPPQDSPGASIFRYREFGSNDVCTLPNWNAALQHVRVAHHVCPDFVFVGWDVAFTPHGVMVLEGNANWEAAAYQMLRGEPLGCTKFADILAARLRDAPACSEIKN